jgi:hypothetical protein
MRACLDLFAFERPGYFRDIGEHRADGVAISSKRKIQRTEEIFQFQTIRLLKRAIQHVVTCGGVGRARYRTVAQHSTLTALCGLRLIRAADEEGIDAQLLRQGLNLRCPAPIAPRGLRDGQPVQGISGRPHSRVLRDLRPTRAAPAWPPTASRVSPVEADQPICPHQN